MGGGGVCAVCGGEASQWCGRCHNTAYCGKEHQKEHWKEHKPNCSPYRICESEQLGRYLEATRDINPGEIIMKDLPIVLGPRQVTVAVCLGCFTPVNGSYKCVLCGWPLCGPQCLQSPMHLPECHISRNRGSKVEVKKFMQVNEMYECITPLRCLWLKEKDKARWNALWSMESHLKERQSIAEIQEHNQKNIVDFINKYLNTTCFTDEEIHTVCGIIDVNGFEIPGPNVVGLYGKACMLEHNCIPNSSRTFDQEFNIVIRAAVKIPKGSHITTSYTDPMWGTANREMHLLTTKFFRCTCTRCKDPSELGTHLSSLRCCQCGSQAVLPSPSPQDIQFWQCSTCPGRLTEEQVSSYLKGTGEKLVTLKDLPLSASEAFLKSTANRLSENHYYRSDVKLALAQMYGRTGGPKQPDLKDLAKEQLERKEALCREVLKLATVFCPGETRLRGLLLYELQASCREKHRRQPKKLKYTEQAKTVLKECEDALREASKILQRESPLQQEYHIGLQAESELAEVTAQVAKMR